MDTNHLDFSGKKYPGHRRWGHWIKNFKYNQQALPFDIDPENCGHTLAFLLSDLSRAITGQTIYVDAGRPVCCLTGFQRRRNEFNSLKKWKLEWLNAIFYYRRGSGE